MYATFFFGLKSEMDFCAVLDMLFWVESRINFTYRKHAPSVHADEYIS